MRTMAHESQTRWRVAGRHNPARPGRSGRSARLGSTRVLIPDRCSAGGLEASRSLLRPEIPAVSSPAFGDPEITGDNAVSSCRTARRPWRCMDQQCVKKKEMLAAFAAHKGEVTEGYLANPSAVD